VSVTGWGRVIRPGHDVTTPDRRDAGRLAASPSGPLTLHGQGRSYGDTAINEGGTVLRTGRLDRFLAADWETGVIRAQAGLTIDALLRVCVPRGWFVPVTPGTKHVSLGGAVASDVHGKNHHHVGAFGAHVRALGLVRSDREAQVLRPGDPLFALTVSGLGLTGLIDWVEIQLIPIASDRMIVENIPHDDLDHFMALSEESADWPYVVAWVDCLAKGDALGRGVFTRGRHARNPGPLTPHPPEPRLAWPFRTPGALLNRHSVGMFNALYRRRPGARFDGMQHYAPFFHPLDGIARWNLMYGSGGFYQHQCIIPRPAAREGVSALLETVARAGQGSFLAVMKSHGAERSPGALTFCLDEPGVTLALDFANRGPSTYALVTELDAIAHDHGGRMYPAKDATMSQTIFTRTYPRWEELEAARDPVIHSHFWRRVTGIAA